MNDRLGKVAKLQPSEISANYYSYKSDIDLFYTSLMFEEVKAYQVNLQLEKEGIPFHNSELKSVGLPSTLGIGTSDNGAQFLQTVEQYPKLVDFQKASYDSIYKAPKLQSMLVMKIDIFKVTYICRRLLGVPIFWTIVVLFSAQASPAKLSPASVDWARVRCVQTLNVVAKKMEGLFFSQKHTADFHLTSTQKESLSKNMELMGLSNYGPELGDIHIWELLFYNGITVASHDNESMASLADILLRPHSDSTELKDALNSWAQQENIDTKFIWIPEIRQKVRDFEFEVSGNVTVESGNGFIADDLYTYLASDSYHPIGDPHDVLSHLSSLSDPVFRTLFRRYTSLSSSIRTRRYGLNSSWAIYSDILQRLDGYIRDVSHENWTYIVKSPTGKPELLLQGNQTFNALIKLYRRGDAANFVNHFLSAPSSDPRTIRGNYDLKTLPYFDQFITETHSEGLYSRYISAIHDQAIEKGELEIAKRKLAKFMKKNKSLYSMSRPARLDNINILLQKLAGLVQNDPQLKVLFSKEGKEEFLNVVVTFFEKYKIWIDARLN